MKNTTNKKSIKNFSNYIDFDAICDLCKQSKDLLNEKDYLDLSKEEKILVQKVISIYVASKQATDLI